MKYKYNGQWYDLSCSLNVSNLLIGEIIEYAGESIPGGYLVCDGSAVSRTEYSELFDVIGTIYGSGDGSTTFNLPDLRGKVVTGLNTTNSNFNVLGKTGGEEAHTLTINEMPSHNHKMYSPASVTVAAGSNYGIPDLGISTTPTTNTGGDQPHNNLQPYITINYLIRAKKTKNVLASGSTVVNSLNGDSTVDAPSVRAVNEGLGNIGGQILWTNPNPTENFASQTITLNSNDYDYLWWIFYNSTEAVKVISAYSIKGLGVNINEIINLNIGVSQSTGFRERQISYINDKQYSITNCLERASSASSTPIEKQNRLILAYVIGYKTGLFN